MDLLERKSPKDTFSSHPGNGLNASKDIRIGDKGLELVDNNSPGANSKVANGSTPSVQPESSASVSSDIIFVYAMQLLYVTLCLAAGLLFWGKFILFFN